MSIEGGFNRKIVPASEKIDTPEAANDNYTPDSELLASIARSSGLKEDATAAEVAENYLRSLAFSETEFGKQQGSPEDMLPRDVEAGAFRKWAERTAEAA